jgi:RND family efflux transporter MFP subunit
MNESINSQRVSSAAKAALLERLVRTAKAVRFHGSLRSKSKAVRFRTSLRSIAQAEHFHTSLRSMSEAVRFHATPNVILSAGPAYETRSERRTHVFRAHQAPIVEAQGLSVCVRTALSPRWGWLWFHFASPGLRPGLHSGAAPRRKGSSHSTATLNLESPRRHFGPAKKLLLKWALAPVATLAALLSLAACSSQPRTVSAAPEAVRGVQLLTAQRATVPDWLEAVGTLQAAQTSQLSAQIMGNIVEMRVKEGDRVQRGEVLAVLEDAQPQAAVQRATAAENAAQQEIVAADSDYSLADATFKRYQELYNKKSVSPQEFDEIKARQQAAAARRQLARAGLAQAQATLTQAQTMLSYTRVRAPFDSVVTEKRADPGTLASPGMVLLVVEDQRRFRLEASVDEGDIHLLKLGQAMPVTLDSLPGAQFSGRVAQIVPAADPASRSFMVKVELPADARLRSGLFGRARIARGQRQAILLPRSALLDRGQLQGVYVVGEDRVATLRYITLGKLSGEQVEVLSGLQGGERVVAAPGDRELGGKRVEPSN